MRNPATNSDHLVLVNQDTPPQFDGYAHGGYDDRTHEVMNFEAIEAAKGTARQVERAPATDVRMRDTYPNVRPWNLDVTVIRQGGALFNVMQGASFSELGAPMLLVPWPGYGVCRAGLHMGGTPAGARPSIHTHPDSDECCSTGSATARCTALTSRAPRGNVERGCSKYCWAQEYK